MKVEGKYFQKTCVASIPGKIGDAFKVPIESLKGVNVSVLQIKAELAQIWTSGLWLTAFSS